MVNRHLYEYHPETQFDAIVNLGVTEHLPDYRRSLNAYRKFWVYLWGTVDVFRRDRMQTYRLVLELPD